MTSELGVVRSLRRSAELARARPLASVVLGGGVVLSLVSLCCGIGALMAPWILCELLAMQLSEELGAPVERSRSWIGAGAVLLAAVLLVGSVGWVTWLGLGTDPISLAGTANDGEGAGWMRLGSGGAWLAAASSVVSWVFVLPFFYTPLILLGTRATLRTAVLESARLVARGGAFTHFRLAFVANLVQVLPLVIAAALATLLSGSDRSALWMLFALPLLALSLPLGQGMVVTSYAQRRAELSDVSRTKLAGQPPWALVVLWIMLVSAPLLSFGMLGASLVRPSRIPLGSVPAAEEIGRSDRLSSALQVYPYGTALQIEIDARRARVTAGDGGGAGSLPLRSGEAIDAARVVRVRERYGIELMQGGQRYATWIDRAGVRLDDDLQARLFDRVPGWALLAMLGGLLAIALALLPVLASLGELRRLFTLAPGERPAARELSERRSRTLRRAALAGVALSPLALVSLYWGLQSLLG